MVDTLWRAEAYDSFLAGEQDRASIIHDFDRSFGCDEPDRPGNVRNEMGRPDADRAGLRRPIGAIQTGAHPPAHALREGARQQSSGGKDMVEGWLVDAGRFKVLH